MSQVLNLETSGLKIVYEPDSAHRLVVKELVHPRLRVGVQSESL